MRILEGRLDGEEVDDLLSHKFMPLPSRMNTVARVLELRIVIPLFGEGFLHHGVQVDYLPTILALRDQPLGVGRHDVVVIELGVGFVVDRRGHEDDFPTLCLDLVFQAFYALLVLGEAFFLEGHVDPAVDAVAGDDQIGSQSLQGTVQALAQVRPRKAMPEVSGFGQAGHGFAWYALVEHFWVEFRVVDGEPSLEKQHVLAPIGDAVSEEDDLLRAFENSEVFIGLSPERQKGEQGEKKEREKAGIIMKKMEWEEFLTLYGMSGQEREGDSV